VKDVPENYVLMDFMFFFLMEHGAGEMAQQLKMITLVVHNHLQLQLQSN